MTHCRLAALPLVRAMIQSPVVTIVRRPLDPGWLYERRSGHVGCGWNPFRSEIYIGDRSRTAAWLDHPGRDLRTLNEGDHLVRECVFAVHDYLHVWAALTVRELCPALGFGTAPITPDNIEQQVFALLTTEAVATVGLDYWYLSTFQLNDRLDIGTSLTQLTVSYRTLDDHEYTRLNPAFEAQSPAFFRHIANFYCSGRFPGFNLDDLRRSPVLLGWLQHELRYGEQQRRYSRQWLQHLSGQSIYPTDAALRAPVGADAPWQQQLLAELGTRLWAKVKQGEHVLPARGVDADATWRAPQQGPIDFRFTNLNALPDDAVDERGIVEASRPHFIDQLLRTLPCPAEGSEAAAIVDALHTLPSMQLIRWCTRQLGARRPSGDDIADLFFPR